MSAVLPKAVIADKLKVIARAEARRKARDAAKLKKAWIVKARHEFAYFSSYVLRSEGSGEPIALSLYHRQWAKLWTQYRRSVVWSHPEGGKTWQLIAFVLWCLGRNPNLRIAWVSGTYGQAQKPVKAIMQYLLGSKELKEVFPNLKRSKRAGDPFGVDCITVERSAVSKDGSLMTCGAYGSILGSRIDILIIDDLIDFANTRTKDGRDKMEEWVTTTLLSRVVDGGSVICVGNAWHSDDLLHRWAANPLYTAIKCPLLESPGVSSWPEVWPLSRIDDKREEVKPLLFARLYLCEVVDDESTRFKAIWLQNAIERGASRHLPESLPFVPDGYSIHIGLDPGVSQDRKSDLSSLVVIAIHPNQDRELLHAESGRWTGPELLDRVVALHQRYHAIVHVETNAAQDFLRQWLNHETMIPVLKHNTGASNKHSPVWGVETLAAEFSIGKWIFPQLGPYEARLEQAQLLKEMREYDPKAHTGDRLMAFWIAREGARRWHEQKASSSRRK